ncbi:MAG: orotate phosphoribosyltransferase [Chloroflexota bacterium]
MITPTLDILAATLFDIGAVRFGQFTLHSGRVSPIYLDLRLLVSYPAALRLATAAYRERLAGLQFDLLAAFPYAGLPIGTALCLDMDVPLIYPRKTTKSYGTGKEIEGKWEVGQTAAVIDDVITSGDSLLQMIAALKAAGLKVRDALVLVDREQGGRQLLEAGGYQLHAVLTLRRLLASLEDQGRITPAQRAAVLNR